MAACAIKPGDRVVHVGAGVGYYTAILAELVGEAGHVSGFEIDTVLATAAARNLARWSWASVDATSGINDTLPQADLIYVNAGVEDIPRAWLASLLPAGRLLLPLAPRSTDRGGCFVIQSVGASAVLQVRFVCHAQFVPCVGAQDDAVRERIVEAFRMGGCETVRSLRLHPELPDDSAWLRGPDWWLSTRAVDAAEGPTPR
jgi:protein-L-isoaspartate(D-aspartate) O-methyltransferase